MRGFDNSQEPKQKYSLLYKLRNKQLGLRLFVGLVFFICLALFLHFREVRLEVLELNTTADRYLIGQVDFEFPDEETTIILKQEAVRDVGTIFKIDEKEVRQRRIEFENRLKSNQRWREKVEGSTFEEMHKGITGVEEALLKARFTDERTLQKMRDLGLSTTSYYVFVPAVLKSSTLLPPEFWSALQVSVFQKDSFHPGAAVFILAGFENQQWNLQQDDPTERKLRQVVQELIPQKFTKVEAGEILIMPGERVSQRHLVMMQAMKEGLKNAKKLSEPLSILGSSLLAFFFILMSAVYFRINHKEMLESLSKLTLLITIMILTLILAKGSEYFLLHTNHSLFNAVRYPLLVPFASLLICVLLKPDVAMFCSGFLAVVLGISLAVPHDRFLVINLIAALVTIICARTMHKRKEVFTICGKVWLSCVVIVLAFNLVENSFFNFNVLADLATTFVFMLFTAILVIGLLPILESIFNVMTDMSLMEYMDPNSVLLRRLSLEAPGTYQHCLVVGNLAEIAARAIGANGLFCRVATLYHDIGKLFNPHYFTENQLGGFDIHQLLTSQESAQVIIAHVAEGEGLARRHRLPQSFIDIILEHHGTTLVYFFYCKQVEQMGGDVTKVDEKLFRYPGPKPHSKESAIIMLADTVEAASRSLDEVTEESVSEMVERLVADKAEDGQLNETQLTFEELGLVKKAMIKTLIVTRHLRVKYPAKH